MDTVLRMSHEEFIAMLSKADLGYCSSLQNLLKMQYEQCTLTKEGLIVILQENPNLTPEDIAEINKNKDNMYLLLQIIEDKNNILEEYIKGLNKC